LGDKKSGFLSEGGVGGIIANIAWVVFSEGGLNPLASEMGVVYY